MALLFGYRALRLSTTPPTELSELLLAKTTHGANIVPAITLVLERHQGIVDFPGNWLAGGSNPDFGHSVFKCAVDAKIFECGCHVVQQWKNWDARDWE